MIYLDLSLSQWYIQIYHFHNDLSRSITLTMIYQMYHFHNDLSRSITSMLSIPIYSIYHPHWSTSITVCVYDVCDEDLSLGDLSRYHFHNDLWSITLTMIYHLSLPQWSIKPSINSTMNDLSSHGDLSDLSLPLCVLIPSLPQWSI